MSLLFNTAREWRVPIVTYQSPVSHLRGFQNLLPLKFEIFEFKSNISPRKLTQIEICFQFSLSTSHMQSLIF